MPDLGYYLIWLSVIVAVYAAVVSAVAARTRRADLTLSAENAVTAMFILAVGAVAVLEYLFLSDRFDVHYVATHSSHDLPTAYKFTALWSGMEGSLLFWAFVLSGYGFFAVHVSRKFRGPLASTATAVLSVVQLFFVAVIAIYENPFRLISDVERVPFGFAPPDGQGMNPLLVHPAMAIHPPILYLGYVGFAVPYAFALAALITRQVKEGWARATRRWTIMSWFFLGVGQLLGGKWAYVVLGWGGYWGWDPVENAALLPWLTATAFLHSIIIQEKKGMLKIWNMVLIILTFTLCIYGTFLTRSGIVSSVHSFAQSPVGPTFLLFVTAIMAVSAYFLFTRLKLLKSRNEYESAVSREGGFLLNNLLLLGAMFAILWGVMFPVVSEAITGSKVTVGPPFFNSVMVPIGLLLLFLTGVGPLLAWRKTSVRSLKRNFTGPLLFGLFCGAVAYALGVHRVYALISLTLCGFVVATVVAEFHRGARARGRSVGESYLVALWKLTGRNRRRYGGYIVHLGIVLLFVGFTGNAFNKEAEGQLKQGEWMEVGRYRLVYEGSSESVNPLTSVVKAQLGVYLGDTRLGTLWPHQLVYYKRKDQQHTTEVAIRSTLREDLYVVYQGQNNEGAAFFRAHVNPLVAWVWIGAILLTLGTIVVMWPDRLERQMHEPLSRVPQKGRREETA